MREVERRYHIKPRAQLSRGADGRLKPAAAERDIADIWAEQRRIRLQEAILEDKRRIERKQQRGARIDRWKAKLRRKPKSIKPAVKTEAGGSKEGAKELVVQLSMPKLKLPKLAKRLPWGKMVLVFGMLLVACMAVWGAVSFWPHKESSTAQRNGSGGSTGVLDSQTTQPDYPTVLPAGKSIAQLGGWGRVSPPDQAAVFAYADKLSDVPISVTEQPLPANFRADPQSSVTALAQQSGATQVLSAGDSTMHLATTTKGVQEVFLVKNNLLILIRANGKIPDQQWTQYIKSLQ